MLYVPIRIASHMLSKSTSLPGLINVCIHRRTVWKIGTHAKYVILIKYRDYYYYYCCEIDICSRKRPYNDSLTGDGGYMVLINP